MQAALAIQSLTYDNGRTLFTKLISATEKKKLVVAYLVTGLFP